MDGNIGSVYLRRIEFEIEKPEKLISQIRGQKLIKKDRITSLSLSIYILGTELILCHIGFLKWRI
jgi:hypothetical protein